MEAAYVADGADPGGPSAQADTEGMESSPLGGGRFRMRYIAGPPAAVEKSGYRPAVAREAKALAALGGVPGVPDLLGYSPGTMRMERLAGAPRPLNTVSPRGLHALGARLRVVHRAVASPLAGLPTWQAAAPSAAALSRGRCWDALALAAQVGIEARLEPPPVCDPPFALIHGDLVTGNIVWNGETPGIVDWEFWRFGDPAEDLAYLLGVNGLDGERRAAVLAGYGGSTVRARVAGWEPVVTLEAAAWWVREGRPDLAAPLLERFGL